MGMARVLDQCQHFEKQFGNIYQDKQTYCAIEVLEYYSFYRKLRQVYNDIQMRVFIASLIIIEKIRSNLNVHQYGSEYVH